MIISIFSSRMPVSLKCAQLSEAGILAAEIVNEVEIRLPPDMRQIAELDDVEEDEIDD